MEGWGAELVQGRPDATWDLFLDRYRRLIFAATRHYAQDNHEFRSTWSPDGPDDHRLACSPDTRKKY